MSKFFILNLIFLSLFVSGCQVSKELQDKINKDKSPYEADIFPSEAEAIKKPVVLKFSGSVPKWLSGTYVRTGSGKFKIGDTSLTHWFDGFAFLTSFEFKNGSIIYKSAFVESDQLKSSLAQNRIMLSGFADNMTEGPALFRSRDGQMVKTSNPNVNVEKIGKHFVALGETPLPVEFDLASLDTVGIFDYADDLKKSKSWESAHFKKDPKNGNLYNLYIDYGRNSYYVLYKIANNSTKRELLAKYKVDKPSYMHDFSITEKYIILTAYPLVVNPIDLLNPKNSFIGAHRWEPDRKTKILIFDKISGQLVKEYKMEAMFAFHHINAFENHLDQIDLYLSADDNADGVLKVAKYPRVYSGPKLKKLVIDMSKDLATQVVLSKSLYEMPRVPETLVGFKMKYFYAILFTPGKEKKGFGIAKFDINKNTDLVWYEDNIFPGEPIFIPKPDGKSEDDGIILSILYDANLKKSFLLILDARDMKELAKGEIPQLLPFGFHGRLLK
jgi:beta,beta-carotene 9',10'-dioxygenase